VTVGLPGAAADLRRGRTRERPGPGPTPEALLRALDLTVGRRIRGLLPGEYRAHDLGGGTELAPDVLRHRLVLSYAALTDGITADTVIGRVLKLVPAPQLDLAMEPTA